MLNFSDIILRHNKSVVNSREECDTSAYLGKNKFRLPVMSSNMPSVLNRELCSLYDYENLFYVYHRIDGIEDVLNFVRFANKNLKVTSISVGVTQDWINLVRLIKQLDLSIDYFTVDVALSYNDNIIPILESIKKNFPNSFTIIGNGATGEWVEWLDSLGVVNAFKMNIGVSKVCRTAQYTGFSNPTVSSLIECSEVNKQLKNPMTVISDGGLTVGDDDEIWIGDVAKALVVGANWVMSGALFSRCLDNPAVVHGYYGNASERAKKGLSRIEGEITIVKSSKLNTVQMISKIQESLQSSISYSGGRNIWEMKELTKYYVLKPV